MSETILKQASRWLQLTTTLGEDAVLAEEMEGREGISELFSFDVSAVTKTAIQPAALLGSAVTLSVSRFGTKTRHVNGIVTAFSAGEVTRDEYRRLRLVVGPSFSILTHSSNFRIFQEKTVVEIAGAIFSGRSLSNYRFDIVGTKTARAYCVQFGETDLAFVSRLFEEEGYFYFFEHTGTTHTMVVTDSQIKYPACVPAGFEFTPNDDGMGVGLVQNLLLQRQLVDMKSTSRQFDFTAPASPIDGTTSTSLSFTSQAGWEHFQYGEGPAVAARQTALSQAVIDASDREFEILSGTSAAPELTPGHKFKLTTTLHAGVKLANGTQPGIDQESFVLTGVTHSARDPSYFNRRPGEEGKPFYRVRFTAIPADRPFRPRYPTAKPLAFGPQTAIVVGPSGNEIYTDLHGRVRVQFHWDRLGTKDENSSCFIRVAQSWAGNSWGLQFIPRIGMEVVVHFLDGDPDQPLVTGVLYNGANVPPFALPAQMNKSGLRTRSTKTGSAETFSELSFDDTKDSEIVLFHAQKDFTRKVENDDLLDVLHDQTRTVKNNRTTTISEGNETLTISKGNRTETISEGNEALTISKGNRTAELTKGNDTLTLGAGNLSIALDGGNMAVELTKGNITQKCTAGAVTIEAATSITLKCGQSVVELKPQGITIEGPLVTVKATGKAELSGAMVDVKASGIMGIKGSMVNIN